jgi:hypothetical protein
MTLLDDLVTALGWNGYTFVKGDSFDGSKASLVKNCVLFKYSKNREGNKKWGFTFKCFFDAAGDEIDFTDLLAQFSHEQHVLYNYDFASSVGSFVSYGGATLSIASGKMKVLGYAGAAQLNLSTSIATTWEVGAKVKGGTGLGFLFNLNKGTTWGATPVANVASDWASPYHILINSSAGLDKVDTGLVYDGTHEYSISFHDFNWTTHVMVVTIDGVDYNANIWGKSYAQYPDKIESVFFMSQENAPQFVTVDDFSMMKSPYLPNACVVVPAECLYSGVVPGSKKHCSIVKMEAIEQ